MNARKHLTAVIVLLFGICLGLHAEPEKNKANLLFMKYQEGVHYKKLDNSLHDDPAVAELAEAQRRPNTLFEFFSYGCHFCADLEPHLQAYLKHLPSNTAVVRIPVIFNQVWEPLARAYHLKQQFQLNEKFDSEFFEAVHKKGLNFSDNKVLGAFFAQFGVDSEKLQQNIESFGIDVALKQDVALAQRFEIMGVPTVIVRTPKSIYRTDINMAGGASAVFDVAQFLMNLDAVKKK